MPSSEFLKSFWIIWKNVSQIKHNLSNSLKNSTAKIITIFYHKTYNSDGNNNKITIADVLVLYPSARLHTYVYNALKWKYIYNVSNGVQECFATQG